MTIKHAAIISVSAIVALCAPLDIPAHARGGGIGIRSFHSINSSHFAKHFRHARVTEISISGLCTAVSMQCRPMTTMPLRCNRQILFTWLNRHACIVANTTRKP